MHQSMKRGRRSLAAFPYALARFRVTLEGKGPWSSAMVEQIAASRRIRSPSHVA